jgi:hypothetical protein
VERVELRLQAGEIHVYLEHVQEANWLCTDCSAPSPLYDHQPERCWRHLDTCQYQTILHASPPRTACQEARSESCGVTLGGSGLAIHRLV